MRKLSVLATASRIRSAAKRMGCPGIMRKPQKQKYVYNIADKLLPGMEREDNMNIRQDKDLAIKFDLITRKLRESGKDLSRIKITTNEDAKNNSYITRRIMQDLEGGAG